MITFCIQIYWREKKHPARRNLMYHLVQNFTSRKLTVLTFNVISEQKIPHPLLVVNVLCFQWIFLMLCLKCVFLLCFKWKQKLGHSSCVCNSLPSTWWPLLNPPSAFFSWYNMFNSFSWASFKSSNYCFYIPLYFSPCHL